MAVVGRGVAERWAQWPVASQRRIWRVHSMIGSAGVNADGPVIDLCTFVHYIDLGGQFQDGSQGVIAENLIL